MKIVFQKIIFSRANSFIIEMLVALFQLPFFLAFRLVASFC